MTTTKLTTTVKLTSNTDTDADDRPLQPPSQAPCGLDGHTISLVMRATCNKDAQPPPLYTFEELEQLEARASQDLEATSPPYAALDLLRSLWQRGVKPNSDCSHSELLAALTPSLKEKLQQLIEAAALDHEPDKLERKRRAWKRIHDTSVWANVTAIGTWALFGNIGTKSVQELACLVAPVRGASKTLKQDGKDKEKGKAHTHRKRAHAALTSHEVVAALKQYQQARREEGGGRGVCRRDEWHLTDFRNARDELEAGQGVPRRKGGARSKVDDPVEDEDVPDEPAEGSTVGDRADSNDHVQDHVVTDKNPADTSADGCQSSAETPERGRRRMEDRGTLSLDSHFSFSDSDIDVSRQDSATARSHGHSYAPAPASPLAKFGGDDMGLTFLESTDNAPALFTLGAGPARDTSPTLDSTSSHFYFPPPHEHRCQSKSPTQHNNLGQLGSLTRHNSLLPSIPPPHPALHPQPPITSPLPIFDTLDMGSKRKWDPASAVRELQQRSKRMRVASSAPGTEIPNDAETEGLIELAKTCLSTVQHKSKAHDTPQGPPAVATVWPTTSSFVALVPTAGTRWTVLHMDATGKLTTYSDDDTPHDEEDPNNEDTSIDEETKRALGLLTQAAGITSVRSSERWAMPTISGFDDTPKLYAAYTCALATAMLCLAGIDIPVVLDALVWHAAIMACSATQEEPPSNVITPTIDYQGTTTDASTSAPTSASGPVLDPSISNTDFFKRIASGVQTRFSRLQEADQRIVLYLDNVELLSQLSAWAHKDLADLDDTIATPESSRDDPTDVVESYILEQIARIDNMPGDAKTWEPMRRGLRRQLEERRSQKPQPPATATATDSELRESRMNRMLCFAPVGKAKASELRTCVKRKSDTLAADILRLVEDCRLK